MATSSLRSCWERFPSRTMLVTISFTLPASILPKTLRLSRSMHSCLLTLGE